MRWAMLTALLLLSACDDDNETSFATDAGTTRALLPRPGTLERAPTALPDELKPPR